jgi:hypothetical protein
VRHKAESARDLTAAYDLGFKEAAEDLNALRLGKDQLAHQLSVTIQERDAERSLSDALASALRQHYPEGPDGDAARLRVEIAALSLYDTRRGTR